MKLRYLLAFLPLFLIACESIDVSKVSDSDLERVSEKLIVCNKPYIRLGSTCCLDTNNNSICDNDEVVKKEERFDVVNETPQKINETKIIEGTTTQEEYKSSRTTIEEFHGHFKTQLEVQTKLNRKGLENVRQYLEMCLFAYLCIALNRVQHGITEGLIDLGGLV